MQTKRAVFSNKFLPYALLAPQLAITLVFFFWPAGQAIKQSFFKEDPFGLSGRFVGLTNYQKLFLDVDYLNSIWTTVVFSVSTTVFSLGLALAFAVCVDRLIRARDVYSNLLLWPYAVAPAVAGILWWFMFNPTVGILPYMLDTVGYDWNHRLNKMDAMILVVLAASWKQLSYNFIFFLAGLQAIPKSIKEAAAIDGAGPVKSFFTITLPLLSPTSFFLLVVNIVASLFDSFAIIDATTAGGPAQGTNVLVYKVFQDGFVGLRLGSSAAQSVLLMLIVVLLTVVQFRYIERRVQY